MLFLILVITVQFLLPQNLVESLSHCDCTVFIEIINKMIVDTNQLITILHQVEPQKILPFNKNLRASLAINSLVFF